MLGAIVYNTHMRWLFAFIVSLLTSVIISYGVDALEQPDISITMSPASSRLQLEPGKTYESRMTIINDGKQAYDFLVYTAPYSMNTETYDKPDFLTQKPRSDLYKWITLGQKKYHIESGKSVSVPYKITVPKNMSPGGHYGVIFAEIQPTKEEEEAMAAANQVNRKKRVGTIFYSTVSGAITRQGNFGRTIIPFWQYDAPLKVAQQVVSTGNSDFDARYQVAISDIFGTPKYKEEKVFIVLPDTTRRLELSWDKSVWYGLYKVQTKVSFLNKTKTQEHYVLLIPIWMVFVAVVLLLGGVYAVYRRYRK